MASASTNYTDIVGPAVSAAWLNEVNAVAFPNIGSTSSRPTLTVDQRGVMYFDTTLATNGKPIWWTGTHWVDSSGTIA